MNLEMDPLPTTNSAAAPPPPHSAYAANPTPTHPSVHNHPPYAEMIMAAIAALNERNGSSKKAIVKYIESHFSNLPPTHSVLLSHHLKRLKSSNQILMVKHSYKLPRSGSTAAPLSVSDHPSASVGLKKRPGRPPNPKSVQAPVPVFAQQPIPTNDAPPETQTRGRGRPPKKAGAKLGAVRPPKSGVVQSGVRRNRGRPKKIVAPPAARVKRLGKSLGRPRKLNNAEGGMTANGAIGDGPLPVSSGEVLQEVGKRRGRPPKDGAEAKRPKKVATGDRKIPRKLGEKPLGRPKKNASAAETSQAPDNQLLMAYIDLKGKLEYLQSRIQKTAIVIKPHLNNETAVSALQELETLAVMNASTSNVQSYQPPPPQEPPTQ